MGRDGEMISSNGGATTSNGMPRRENISLRRGEVDARINRIEELPPAAKPKRRGAERTRKPARRHSRRALRRRLCRRAGFRVLSAPRLLGFAAGGSSSMRLILASTSPRRSEIFSLLGIPFEVVAPPFEEIISPSRPIGEEVLDFAVGKAASVAVNHPDAVVIGSDTRSEERR